MNVCVIIATIIAMKDAEQHAKRLKDLMSELVDFAEIDRQIHFPDRKSKNRKENDSEHSYSLAMCAWYLSAFIPDLDQAIVLKMALAHDIVELHAGDVMAIGRTKEEENSKKLRETAALAKLKNDWADFADLTNTLETYEKKDSREAIFVYSLDKILPMQLNLLSEGKSWKIFDLKREDIISNKDRTTRLSPEVHSIWQELRKEVLSCDDYFNKGKS
jgi:putative hydrolase of HD superfamily